MSQEKRIKAEAPVPHRVTAGRYRVIVSCSGMKRLPSVEPLSLDRNRFDTLR